MKKNLLIASILLFVWFGAVAQTDYTSSITNANFEAGSLNGWTADPTTGFAIKNNTSWKKADGSQQKQGNYFSEFWIAKTTTASNAKLYQQVTNLTDGYYKLTAIAQAVNQNNLTELVSGVSLYAGSDSVAVNTTGIYTIYFEVNTESLEIGIVSGTTTANWICVDDFKLVRVGDDESAVITSNLAILQNIYNKANAYFMGVDANLVVATPIDKGQFAQAKYDALLSELNNTSSILGQSPFSGTLDDIFSAETALTTAYENCLPVAEQNGLPDGRYFIKLGNYFIQAVNSDRNLATEASSTTVKGLMSEINLSDSLQVFTLATDAVESRYWIYNEQINRHFNEKSVLKNDAMTSNTWRTLNIFDNGDKFIIQAAGAGAASGYWALEDNQKLISSNIIKITPDAYQFYFISVGQVLSDLIAEANAALANSENNIGEGNGQYVQTKVDELTAAIATAQTALTNTVFSINIIDLKNAIEAFIPNDVTSGLYQQKAENALIYSDNKTITIKVKTMSEVSVYNVNGVLVSKTTVNDRTEIPANAGLYFVKIADSVTKVIVK